MTETDKVRRKTRLFMLGAFVVAGIAFAVIAASGINKNLVYYWTPSDLVSNSGKAYGATIRLGGMVAPGSIVKHGGSSVEFIVHAMARGVADMPRQGMLKRLVDRKPCRGHRCGDAKAQHGGTRQHLAL